MENEGKKSKYSITKKSTKHKNVIMEELNKNNIYIYVYICIYDIQKLNN